jgi:hypothetical protein
MKRFLTGTLLFGCLSIAPVVLSAQDHDGDHDRDAHHAVVYYDRVHKDKHEWNDNEAKNWDRYRNEHHVVTVDFAKAKRNDQQSYWNWRHEHPDDH